MLQAEGRVEAVTLRARMGFYAAAAALALASGGSDCEADLDGGWQPGRTGLAVRPTPVIAAPRDLDARALSGACLQWNDGTVLQPFECFTDQIAFSALEQGPAEADAEYDARRIAAGVVRLWVEDLGGDVESPTGETWGFTEAHVSTVTGETVWADVRVSAAIAYDRATLTSVIAHELGEVVGVAHDRDLGSCMHDPVPVPCAVQAEDLRRARGEE